VELFYICLTMACFYVLVAFLYPPVMVQLTLLALGHLALAGGALWLTIRYGSEE
jgi:hypothetical protein